MIRLLLFFPFALILPPRGGLAAGPRFDACGPTGQERNLFPYRFERGDLHYQDVVTLRDTSKHTGKALEWADQVLLFDAAGGVRAIDVADVAEFVTRRSPRHRLRPNLPDLTVAFVERLPRDAHWHGHVKLKDGLPQLDIDPNQPGMTPKPGDPVTFRIHVRNVGTEATRAVSCHVSIDESRIADLEIPLLAPDATHVFDAAWTWADGAGSLRVEIDPEGQLSELVRWNNTFVEPVHALAVAVVVSRERFEAFQKAPSLVDSFCFEDYVQYQLRCLNGLFAASVHPTSPEGVVERVRCDRVVVVDDIGLPDSEPEWKRQLRRGAAPDGLTGYAALLVVGPLSARENPQESALLVQWDWLRQICRQLGLVNLNAADTTLDQCYVLDKFERYALRRHISPWIRTFMYTAGGFPLAEHEAAYLNRIRGKPRGFRGDYLYQVPARLSIEVLSNVGRPLPGVQIDVFQLQSSGQNAGRIIGVGRRDPLIAAISDEHGRAELAPLPAPAHPTPNGYALRPNPFGRIAVDGSNGLLLLRLRSADSEEFHFLPLSLCNIAALRGFEAGYVHRVPSRFADPGGPPRPPDATTVVEGGARERPLIKIKVRMPAGIPPAEIKEFRVYKRTGFGGDDARPWTLASIRDPGQTDWVVLGEETYFDEFTFDGPYALDTFFAVTIVDQQGRESSPSEPAFLAHDVDAVQFAITGETAYVSLAGGGPLRLAYWSPVAGTQPCQFKPGRVEGYNPAFAGLAFVDSRRLVAADPENHVLGFYDTQRQELESVSPRRKRWPGFASIIPGEFSSPTDVAVDDAGNLYVADRGNHRVQILDAQGGFKTLLDEDFRFLGPRALGFANGHLCVTDRDDTRCRVYDVRSEVPAFIRELPPLVDAGRGLVNQRGEIFITGRPSDAAEWSVLVYSPLGDSAAFKQSMTGGAAEMGEFRRPRGLYYYPSLKRAYMVNDFPFDVRRVLMDP